MPRPKTSVPKFGNWDKNEDLSYIFDKARAEKERLLHLAEGDANDILLEQSFYKNSSKPAGQRTPHSVNSGNAREGRQSILPTAQQDERYTHVNKLQNRETVAGRGLTYVPDTQGLGLNSGVQGCNQPNSPSVVGVLQDPGNQSDALAYNSRLPSGAPSRHPLQTGIPKETALFKARPHVIQDNVHYQERLHAKSTNTPGNVMYEENPAIAKTRSAQGGLEVSSTATNMRRKHAVPRFGDWDSGEGFTEVFNKIRLEKRSKPPPDSIVKPVSPLQQHDEDLYKASITPNGPIMPKKRSRWMWLICCTGLPPHTVEP